MIDEILRYTNLTGESLAIQRIQTEHRVKLVNLWQIPRGARVLEIGCGQGDTTAVLAHCVGPEGFVHGIDIAPADYGAPMTLGQATDRLRQSEIGDRLQIDLQTDFLSTSFAPAQTYDYFVMSHCAWYFASAEQIVQVLQKARKIARSLCFAEWDIRTRLPQQIPHFISVFIQAQCACFAANMHSNIRTLLTPADMAAIVAQAGWDVAQTASIFSPDLQDGAWEVHTLLAEYPGIIAGLAQMPSKLRSMLLSMLETVREKQGEGQLPLDTFLLTARPKEATEETHDDV